MNFSAFNAAHIQHIVDEGEQMVAGCKGLAKIILHPVCIVNIAERQRGKADDGVHGGADIVGHIGKEGTLGAVRALCFFHGDLQFCIQFLRIACGFPCSSFGFTRLLEQHQNREQNNCNSNAADQHNFKEVILYKIAQGNLPRGALIHRKRAGKHINRHCLDRFVQDGQQAAVSAIDRKAGSYRVYQRNAVKAVFLAVFILTADPGNKAICLSVFDQPCRILLCIAVHDLPLRVIKRKVLFQGEFVLGNGNAVYIVFVKVLFVRDRHQVGGPRCVGTGKVILFRQIGVLVAMEDHVDLARFQRIQFCFLAVIADQLEFQFLIAQTICCKLNIVRDYPGKLPGGRVKGADAAVARQKAHPDRTVLSEPRLFLPCKDGRIIH